MAFQNDANADQAESTLTIAESIHKFSVIYVLFLPWEDDCQGEALALLFQLVHLYILIAWGSY